MRPWKREPRRLTERAKVQKSSRFAGVTRRHHNNHGNPPRSRPWEAHIHFEGRLHYLGTFATEEEAAAVAAKAREERAKGAFRPPAHRERRVSAVVAARRSARPEPTGVA